MNKNLACGKPPDIPDATYDNKISDLFFEESLLNFTCDYGKETERFTSILKSSIKCLNKKWTKYSTCPKHTLKSEFNIFFVKVVYNFNNVSLSSCMQLVMLLLGILIVKNYFLLQNVIYFTL